VQPVPTGGSVTGTLSYVEPASLSPEASAIVVLVEHAGDPITARIIESRVMADPGQVPIEFELPYTAEEIDAEALYTVSAAIVDGSRLWVTDNGTRVITYTNPTSDVALELVLRSDLLKGQVTGEITGEGVTLTGSGFAAAVVFDATSNAAVGMAVEPAPTGVPIDFSVPFDPAEIDDTAEYVVVAGIVDEENRWANRDGVPVITNGNPLSGIVVPVTAVEPSPSPEASADSGLSTIALLILLLIIVAVVAAVVWYLRSRSEPPPGDGEGPPEGPPSPEAPPEAADAAGSGELSPEAGSPVQEPTAGADAATAAVELPGMEARGPDGTPDQTPDEEPPPVA
jgi:uncharacterized lipoprotein YbaY